MFDGIFVAFVLCAILSFPAILANVYTENKIIVSCEKMGMFYLNDTVYECKVKK